jgi:ribonuclease HI
MTTKFYTRSPASIIEIRTAAYRHPDTGVAAWVWYRTDGVSAVGTKLNSTRNEMELQAVIEARIAHAKRSLLIHSTSQFVILGITRWVSKWKKKNWRTRLNSCVKFRHQWELLDAATELGVTHFQWVRPGNGDPHYAKAIALARRAATAAQRSAATSNQGRRSNAAQDRRENL